MKLLFQKLVWKPYKTTDKSQNITELEKYADMNFPNGIFVRITTGEMAETNYSNPYEMYVEEPEKSGMTIPFLTPQKVNFILNELDSKTFE